MSRIVSLDFISDANPKCEVPGCSRPAGHVVLSDEDHGFLRVKAGEEAIRQIMVERLGSMRCGTHLHTEFTTVHMNLTKAEQESVLKAAESGRKLVVAWVNGKLTLTTRSVVPDAVDIVESRLEDDASFEGQDVKFLEDEIDTITMASKELGIPTIAPHLWEMSAENSARVVRSKVEKWLGQVTGIRGS